MMENKEIIQALECCAESECENCQYQYDTACKEYIFHDCISLIKRQIEEIERLKKLLDDKCDRCIARDRAEAIKEFVERLKAESNYLGIDADCFICTSIGEWKTWETVGEWCEETVDNLVKEMVGK
jgi:K+/H+ antiporter YhaU regulatory subunit KhtT